MGSSAIWSEVLSMFVWQTNVKIANVPSCTQIIFKICHYMDSIIPYIALLVTSHCALRRKIYSLFVGMQVLCQLKGWDRGPHSDNSSVSEPHTHRM